MEGLAHAHGYHQSPRAPQGPAQQRPWSPRRLQGSGRALLSHPLSSNREPVARELMPPCSVWTLGHLPSISSVSGKC